MLIKANTAMAVFAFLIFWDELFGERLLMRENGSGTRYAIEKFFEQNKLTNGG